MSKYLPIERTMNGCTAATGRRPTAPSAAVVATPLGEESHHNRGKAPTHCFVRHQCASFLFFALSSSAPPSRRHRRLWLHRTGPDRQRAESGVGGEEAVPAAVVVVGRGSDAAVWEAFLALFFVAAARVLVDALAAAAAAVVATAGDDVVTRRALSDSVPAVRRPCIPLSSDWRRSRRRNVPMTVAFACRNGCVRRNLSFSVRFCTDARIGHHQRIDALVRGVAVATARTSASIRW